MELQSELAQLNISLQHEQSLSELTHAIVNKMIDAALLNEANTAFSATSELEAHLQSYLKSAVSMSIIACNNNIKYDRR